MSSFLFHKKGKINMDFLSQFLSWATLQIIFVIITFKLMLSDYEPPIQKSLQALVCVIVGATLSTLLEPSIHGFMTGVICAGISFYGADYINEIRKITDKNLDEE